MRKLVFLTLVAMAASLPVAGASAATPADTAMGNQIGQRLKESGRLKNYRIGVKFEEGVVWLEGSVASAAQRDAAVSVAKSTPGVAHVISHLEIADSAAAMANQNASFENNELAAMGESSQGAMTASAMLQQQRSANFQNQSMPAPQQQARSGNNMAVPMGRMAGRPMDPGAQMGGPGGPGGPGGMQAAYQAPAGGGMQMAPQPAAYTPGGARAASYDNAQMPGYAWPSYAASPNYAAVTYPQQYSPTAWPYIGPFYPYPQVPLGWRKVSLEWDDGWWFLDFSSHNSSQ